MGSTRKRVLEILKLRSSDHVKRLVPYEIINKKGIEIFTDKKLVKKPEAMRL